MQIHPTTPPITEPTIMLVNSISALSLIVLLVLVMLSAEHVSRNKRSNAVRILPVLYWNFNINTRR
jgi:hypothetical protein